MHKVRPRCSGIGKPNVKQRRRGAIPATPESFDFRANCAAKAGHGDPARRNLTKMSHI
jgi:hypothetical protein